MAIRARTGLLCLVFLLLLALAGSGSGSAAPNGLESPQNRVTLISDSVAGVLYWVPAARARFARGFDLDLESIGCRKLVDPGCPQPGEPHPPSVLATIGAFGSQISPTVVIDVGYNDLWHSYGDNLDTVMKALVAAGVQHIVWVTLEEFQAPWIEINKAIRAAPERWSQLIVADWALVAAKNPTWFYDGVHMDSEGGLAFADFLRPYVLQACGEPCAPPPPLEVVTARLPLARVGKPYGVTVLTRGGTPPLGWSVIGLPRGLHLNDVGRISGTPRAAGLSMLTFRLRDSRDQAATVDLLLRVRRRA